MPRDRRRWAALRRIAYYAPTLAGRRVALGAIGLAAILITVAVTRHTTHIYVVRREARPFAEVWFRQLREGQPQLAHRLHLNPEVRDLAPENFWEVYDGDAKAQGELQRFVDQPEVRALMHLGEDAVVRHYDTAAHVYGPGRDTLVESYAVTYTDEEDEQRKTFFVSLVLDRKVDGATGKGLWQVLGTFSGDEAVPAGLVVARAAAGQ